MHTPYDCWDLLTADRVPSPGDQLETVELQNGELMAAAQESEQERATLRDELKAAVDKVGELYPADACCLYFLLFPFEQ